MMKRFFEGYSRKASLLRIQSSADKNPLLCLPLGKIIEKDHLFISEN